jgi:hypothetical protein
MLGSLLPQEWFLFPEADDNEQASGMHIDTRRPAFLGGSRALPTLRA